MAKGVRKTARKKRTKRSHIFGWIVIALALLLTLADIKDGIELLYAQFKYNKGIF